MECCFPAKRKNKPPTKQYQPFQASNIQVLSEKSPNDILANNTSIQAKAKLAKLSKLKFEAPQQNIPFPPRTANINIAI